MKITAVDVYYLDAGMQRATRRPIVCRVHTDSGLFGDGEAGIAYGMGSTAAFGMVVDLAEAIIGMDPMANEVVWDRLFKESDWAQGGGGIVFSGISAIDIALWDIKGKALNTPCYELLGGKFRKDQRAYASQLQFGWDKRMGPIGKTADYVSITEYAMSQGYDAVKIDFTLYDEDANPIPKASFEGILPQKLLKLVDERLGAIRSACGDDLDIIVENHARTDAPGAIAIGALCDRYNCFAYEETTTPLNPQMHRLVYEKVRTPIASGERIYTRWGFANFFRENAIQLIQPDVCCVGGLTEAKKICDLAQVYDATVQAHVAGSPISTAAALHLQAAIPNFCIHEHHFRSTQPDVIRLCKYDYQPVNGRMEVPELPGLGQELSDHAISTALMHRRVQ